MRTRLDATCLSTHGEGEGEGAAAESSAADGEGEGEGEGVDGSGSSRSDATQRSLGSEERVETSALLSSRGKQRFER